MDNNIKTYKTGEGTINIRRNYVGEETPQDVVKRCILYMLQNDTALTRGNVNGIIENGLKEPHYRRA